MEENKEKTVKKRQECDPAYQWHIQDLYASDEAWEKDYESLTSEIQSLAAYEGRLKEGSEVFVEYMRKKEALMKKFEAIYVYANQRYHEDTGNSFYQGLAGKAQTLSIQLDSAVVFEEPELLAIGKKTIDSWFTQNMDMQLYKRYFYELFRQQKHVLSKEEEAILADVSDMSADVSNIFSMFNNADIRFPSIEGKEGEKIPVSHGRYTLLLESRDVNIRKSAFESVYSQYGQYRNTLAALYAANLKNTAFFAKKRHYNSSLEMALEGGEIPTSVYTNLIDTVQPSNDVAFGTYQGKRVIIDDGCPVENGVYTTYLFGNGAVALGNGNPAGFVPTEMDRAKRKGSGIDYLINRKTMILHPRGIAWQNAAVVKTEGPSRVEVANPKNWKPVYEAKQIRIVAFKHKLG